MFGRILLLVFVVSSGWLAPLLMVAEQAFLRDREQIIDSRTYDIFFSEEEFDALEKTPLAGGIIEISWKGRHWDIFEIHRNRAGGVEVRCHLDLSEDLLEQMVNHAEKSKHHTVPFFSFFFFFEDSNSRPDPASIATCLFADYGADILQQFSRIILQPPRI